MPRTATRTYGAIAAWTLLCAGVAAWTVRHTAGRRIYQGIQIGRAIEAERAAQGVAADTPG